MVQGHLKTEIIKQIERLPPREQAEVIRFAYELGSKRKLCGEELSALAKQMAESDAPTEHAALRAKIVRGFYGGPVGHGA